jgi:cytosine/creatinine deaminase
MSKPSIPTPFYQQLADRINELGGIFNAHLHLDRAGTLSDHYWQCADLHVQSNSHISLHKKHALIAKLHNGPAYETQDIEARINSYLDTMVAVNTFRADSLVDVTPDNVGLSAMQTMLKIKKSRKHEIDLRVGAYSPLGFNNLEPERWDLLLEAAKKADFIGALPEADDVDDYPSNIGFMEHCRRMLKLCQEINKEVHVHVDQRNEPKESGTERLIEAVRQVGQPKSSTNEPMVWAVHLISPSTYDEARFEKLLQGLIEFNIGVICCPSAAIGMRQIRPLMTPTYNCFPRILEMLAAGVHVRLGSDNIADICSPSTTANLIDEIFVLSAAVRFYNVDILAKLASGLKMNTGDREFIRDHLAKNDIEISKVIGQI